MADWLITYGSWCLAPFGLLGMWAAGSRKRWGWVLSMGTQTLWAVYAVGTFQYGFLIGTCSYFAVYLRNWLHWGRTPATEPEETLAVVMLTELIRQDRADEVIAAWSAHGQSCADTDGIIDEVAAGGTAMTAQELARSLQEERTK